MRGDVTGVGEVIRFDGRLVGERRSRFIADLTQDELGVKVEGERVRCLGSGAPNAPSRPAGKRDPVCVDGNM
jgi:hypothetical protein